MGAIEIGAAVGLTALAAFTAGGSLLAMPAGLEGGLGPAGSGMGISGAAMEAGAIADALSSNRGMGITTRQPAAFRQIIRGEQRIGGVIVYSSTTGSTKRQYNLVIALATHEIDSIVNLYLDGRQVMWQVGSNGNITRNGVNFGGTADPGQFIGPNGQKYTFGSEVFCKPYFGDQTALTGFCTDLQANDPTWSPSSQATGGTATAYVATGMGGAIASIDPGQLGWGYADGVVSIDIEDAGGTGSGANGYGVAVGGMVTSYVLTNGGDNYTNPTVTVSPAGS